ncbi:MAG: RNA methyltransferase [Proteobacteria bacterium]|nr:RNA methyltransferase [Pseudomonadota bacterium]
MHAGTPVTSPDNPRLKAALALLASSRERAKRGLVVLEGAHLVDSYRSRYGAPETLIVTAEAAARADISSLVAALPPSRTVVVPARLIADHVSVPADVGVLAVVPTLPAATAGFPPLTLLLEDVQDPGNVGTILRSAAAAGVDQVLLSTGCARAWSPKALRAAQGAQFQLAVVEDVDLVAWSTAFRAQRGRVVALAVRDGVSLYDEELTGPLALAVGNEGAGLSAALLAAAERAVTIPMATGNESLNAAAAAAVALFEARRQRTRR